MPVYIARQGDSVHSIAFAHGFHPDTLWEHAKNKHLIQGKRTRAVLMPGDEVFIPELTPGEESAAGEAKHRYRRKGVPQRFKARFFRFGHPRKGEKYRTTIDGVPGPSGTLNNLGQIDIPVSPGVASITLTLGEGETEEVVEFRVGHLDPTEERSGVVARLRNLGYHVDEDAADPEQELRSVIRAFQDEHELSTSGELDDATRGKLRDLYEWNVDPVKRGEESASGAGRG